MQVSIRTGAGEKAAGSSEFSSRQGSPGPVPSSEVETQSMAERTTSPQPAREASTLFGREGGTVAGVGNRKAAKWRFRRR